MVFSISVLDGRYLSKRRSLGNIQKYAKSEREIWRDFGCEEPAGGRIVLSKNDHNNLEDILENTLIRADNLFKTKNYGKVALLLGNILELTKDLVEKADPVQERLYEFRAAACFHFGMLNAYVADNNKQAILYLNDALKLNEEIVHIAANEKHIGQLLRVHLELGKIYATENENLVMPEINAIFKLTDHYVDILSSELYLSYRKCASALARPNGKIN